MGRGHHPGAGGGAPPQPLRAAHNLKPPALPEDTYFTVNDSVAVCVRFPEVPVTVSAKVPAGVPGFPPPPAPPAVPPPPPQAVVNATTKAAITRARRMRRLLPPSATTTTANPRQQNNQRSTISLSIAGGLKLEGGTSIARAVVVTCTVTDLAFVPSSVMEAGETLQVARAGAPAQLNVIP